MLAETYVRVEGAFPLIGVGGIDSGETALAKIRAGACLIQLYSALVFHGLRLVAAIKSDLSNTLRREGLSGHRRARRRRRRRHDGGGVAGVGGTQSTPEGLSQRQMRTFFLAANPALGSRQHLGHG